MVLSHKSPLVIPVWSWLSNAVPSLTTPSERILSKRMIFDSLRKCKEEQKICYFCTLSFCIVLSEHKCPHGCSCNCVAGIIWSRLRTQSCYRQLLHLCFSLYFMDTFTLICLLSKYRMNHNFLNHNNSMKWCHSHNTLTIDTVTKYSCDLKSLCEW